MTPPEEFFFQRAEKTTTDAMKSLKSIELSKLNHGILCFVAALLLINCNKFNAASAIFSFLLKCIFASSNAFGKRLHL